MDGGEGDRERERERKVEIQKNWGEGLTKNKRNKKVFFYLAK